jgi:hypothetical protein
MNVKGGGHGIISGYYPGISLKELAKITKKLRIAGLRAEI